MRSSSENVIAWRKRTKEKMVKSMGGKCQCCGYDICHDALAFHHIDPSKKDLSFGKIRANPTNWKNIVNELRKCILVCHNCHTEIHNGLRDLPDNYDTFDESFTDFKKIARTKKCPVCLSDMLETRKFCSHKCAQTNKRKVDWDSIDLLDMLEKYGITKLSKKLGVSDATIYKRKKRILQN